VIVFAAVVVACAGVAAAVAVPRLTASTTSTGSTGSAGSGRMSMSADPSLFELAGVFTPPTTAGSWQEVTSVAFSPDGKSLAVGLTTGPANSYSPSDFGGEIYMSNLATGKQSTYMLEAGGTVTFSADGQLLAASGGKGQHLVYLVNSVSGGGAALPFIAGFGGEPIKSLAFSPNGRLLAATNTSGAEISGQRASNAIAFSPDSRTIAVGGSGAIWLWDTGTGSRDASINVSGSGLVGPLAYSPNGKLLVAALPGGKIGLWNAATQARLGTYHDPRSQGTESVAISHDGQMLAVGDGNGKTYLWDLQTGKLITTLTNPVGQVPPGLGTQPIYAVDSVAFSPDGKTLATSDTDGSAYLWRVH
jgi:WD40 repeat protein